MCAIYLRQGEELVAMVEQPYDAETVLQDLLATHPELLGGDEAEGNRWLLVRRELGIDFGGEDPDRWSADHLFLDKHGVPTLVEVKRSSDSRIRREVVGQMLDYASAATVWSPEKVRGAFEEAREAAGEDPDEALTAFLGTDADPDEFWANVDANLHAGRLRLVFVADGVPPELRRVVEFLNEQMTETEVLVLELRQYVEPGGTRQTLVPRLIGRTETARQAKGSRSSRVRRKWTEQDLVSAIREAQPPQLAERMIELYERLRDVGARRSWGEGAAPSVTMWLGERDDASTANPVSASIYTDGVSVNFDFVTERRSPGEMARLARLVRDIPGAAGYFEELEAKGYRMHPGMAPEDVLAFDESPGSFVRALAEAAEPPAEREPPAATST